MDGSEFSVSTTVHPNGHGINTVGIVVTYRHRGHTMTGQPSGVVIVKSRPDLQWSQLRLDRLRLPYEASFAPRNVPVKCRGCRRTIADKTELRLQLKSTYSSAESGPHPGTKTFCLSAQCVQQAIERDFKDFRSNYPAFDGRVTITTKTKQLLRGDLPTIVGIQWIVL